MLLPFQWAVLTREEAEDLVSFIEKATATAKQPKNFLKMENAGIWDTYQKLRGFLEAAEHYDSHLQFLDPSEFQTR